MQEVLDGLVTVETRNAAMNKTIFKGSAPIDQLEWEYVGKDPFIPKNYLYEVTWRGGILPEDLLEADTWVHSAEFTTNCTNLDMKHISWIKQIPRSKDTTTPCLRNDRISIIPPDPWFPAPRIVGAWPILCSCCLEEGYIHPDGSKVDIFDASNGGNVFVKSEFVSSIEFFDVPYLLPGKLYRYEYRNATYTEANGWTACPTVPFQNYFQF
ncbi:hypothetical protein [Nannocystis sp. SCPEA4]|uniref:hypothetical protein n=1 Tax=Nannocystis sp. SCPEA4 TaxID=2996787 RepID=UPI00226E1D99|nr:hypothetical protein [Nannocystis sp. SCPEA4]MCY1054636.1 hypothetical protein [Nannocystis sp. SCPEA4]